MDHAHPLPPFFSINCDDYELCIPCHVGLKHGHHPCHHFEPVPNESCADNEFAITLNDMLEAEARHQGQREGRGMVSGADTRHRGMVVQSIIALPINQLKFNWPRLKGMKICQSTQSCCPRYVYYLVYLLFYCHRQLYIQIASARMEVLPCKRLISEIRFPYYRKQNYIP